MLSKAQLSSLRRRRGCASAVAAMTLMCMAFAVCAQPAQAQTYTVLHSFADGPDGSYPLGGLVADAAGNLYGTTCGATCVQGAASKGTVFRMTQKGSGWLFTPLYSFKGGNDGSGPASGVVIGPDGSLYGTTFEGGGTGCGGTGCGTVFKLRPPPSIPPNLFGSWSETILYRFQGGVDGANPQLAALVFDQSGNLYGETWAGGTNNQGTVFELAPSQGGWTESIVHNFAGGNDGSSPIGGLSWQCDGTLLGTTFSGGDSYGTIFQLTPSSHGWTESLPHVFQGGSDGAYPAGGVLTGCAVVGSTCSQGANGGGTAFILNNGMFYHNFNDNLGDPMPGPWGPLTGSETALYGTTVEEGAYDSGTIFTLQGCAGWGYTSLHDFGGTNDGSYPYAGLLLQTSSNINLFGTTYEGGAHGAGIVFELTLTADDLPQCAKNMIVKK